MPNDKPDFRAYPFHRTHPGSIWQTLRERVIAWFQPTHPRFALHLFAAALASGLLLSLAWLAIHGFAQQLRHGTVITDASTAGPGTPLPTPMTDGKAALSDAGAGHASSWTIQEGGQSAPDPANTESDSVAPDLVNAANTSAGLSSIVDDSAAPVQAVDPDPIPPVPAPAETARVGRPVEVTLSVQIDEQGNPVQISVQNSSGSAALDNAALLIVQNRHFQPVLRDGEPLAATLTVPVQVPMPDR